MFKHIRSFVGKFFDENQQMWVVMYLSEFFWFLRKYFLAVEITYPEDFLKNWSVIKHYSSQDKERNFTVYQMIKVHNEIFPANGDGTSTLDLSLSNVTIGSFFLMTSPALVKISIISTFSKSPISGTVIFVAIIDVLFIPQFYLFSAM